MKFLNETQLLSSSGDCTCLLWDITKTKPTALFLDHTQDVMCLSIWQENQTFISASCDKTTKLWDIRMGEKCVGNFEGHGTDVNTCDWFPDGNAFITGGDDSCVRLFDIRYVFFVFFFFGRKEFAQKFQYTLCILCSYVI
ncbi:guanine nucleotide-binding protein subunit beta [Reticulomyxa filosa]|uniref:Guanine nucleotide-binding protein subunit beta n=1 Tax=Reticulomyxa filosa TaxID=46433 RepID=X6LV31_RETFI|nr:guanine nucleotide-binding protein subunit beta [Reticulomyxa filosa]|eukprot:ETO05459.1 guanine nucleotide-binding protein subunit beta [Reticulomyxa filosa]